jgi:Sec-independent protein secretion pathway component TatC
MRVADRSGGLGYNLTPWLKMLLVAVAGSLLALEPWPWLGSPGATLAGRLMTQGASLHMLFVSGGPDDWRLATLGAAQLLGLTLVMPVLSRQVLLGLVPAALGRKHLAAGVGALSAAFVCGLVFGYLLVVRLASTVLMFSHSSQGYFPETYMPVTTPGYYVSAVATLLVSVGVLFQLVVALGMAVLTNSNSSRFVRQQ